MDDELAKAIAAFGLTLVAIAGVGAWVVLTVAAAHWLMRCARWLRDRRQQQRKRD